MAKLSGLTPDQVEALKTAAEAELDFKVLINSFSRTKAAAIEIIPVMRRSGLYAGKRMWTEEQTSKVYDFVIRHNLTGYEDYNTSYMKSMQYLFFGRGFLQLLSINPQ